MRLYSAQNLQQSVMAQLRLHLQDTASIPAEIAAVLASHQSRFRDCSDTNEVLRQPDLSAAAVDLDEYLRSQLILGYHCSKEPEPGYFAEFGLRVLNRRQHQEDFVAQFGEWFTPEEIAAIRASWDAYFNKGQDIGRNGKIWLCLSRELAKDAGTERLLTYYGGEAIHVPLPRNSTALAKLARIGHSVIVEVAIPGADIEAAGTLASEVLSRYHASINLDVYILRKEGYVNRDVGPTEIVRVLAPGTLD